MLVEKRRPKKFFRAPLGTLVAGENLFSTNILSLSGQSLSKRFVNVILRNAV